MDDILFCTVNTHRISMDALLCSNLNINDFIFAHIAGQKKEVTLMKTELYDIYNNEMFLIFLLKLSSE